MQRVHSGLKPCGDSEAASRRLNILMFPRPAEWKECGLKRVPVVRLERIDLQHFTPICRLGK
jgi:hypothetical protein